MSTYDQRDPGTDPDYCNGLSADYQADLDAMRSAVARLLYPETVPPAIDPLSHTAQTIHAACGDLLDLALTHTTSTDARRLFDLARALRDRLDAVIALSGEQMDTLPLHPF